MSVATMTVNFETVNTRITSGMLLLQGKANQMNKLPAVMLACGFFLWFDLPYDWSLHR